MPLKYNISLKIFILYLLPSLLVCMTSCNKSDNEPELVILAIQRQFNAGIMPVKLSSINEFSDYPYMVSIINSSKELVDNKYFSNEELINSHIDFSEYSLIVVYQLMLGDIIPSKYDWYYNNWDECYQLNITYDCVMDSEYENGEIENFTYIRNAVLVRHILSDSSLALSVGVHYYEPTVY